MSNENTALSLMFYRPWEPLIMPKGDKKYYEFDMPDDYLNKRYRNIKRRMKTKAPSSQKTQLQQIPIKNISVPNITVPRSITKTENFSTFLPKHYKAAGNLIDTLMSQRTIEDFTAVAAYCRDKLNPCLFNYCLSVAMLHRKDTDGIPIPNFLHSFPGRFISSPVMSMARVEAAVIPEDSREPIVIPKDFTANSREPEHKLAYFREDIGINLHHWHWHLVYPFASSNRSIVDKDRRGELFYYMHEQVLARYNAERLCNNMPRVKSFSNLRESIIEGYFPKLDALNSARIWTPRFRNVQLRDIDRPADELSQKIGDLEIWIKNVKDAIAKGYAVDDKGNKIKLDNTKGIDIIGNMIEASMLSPNENLYGTIHNVGHVLIALCHDTDGRFNEGMAVMGDTSTAMRDPIFYRWHCNINDIFVSHKNRLPYYARNQLDFPGLTITSIGVTVANKKPDEFHTYWEQSDVDLSRGLDFAARGTVEFRFTHLQHNPFTFTIKVKNTSNKQVMGTMRIFMAPKYNENGQILPFEEQRQLMMEMDKFTVNLVIGENNIIRQSEESSVTIPYELTFRSLENYEKENPEMVKYKFCGCGWPDHVAIPKGTTNGYAMQLFAMVSNYANDQVIQESSDVCSGAESYCGRLNMKYPDQQNMGYPFDRIAKNGVIYLSDFLTPNMTMKDVSIIHTDITILRDPKNYQVKSTADDPDPLNTPAAEEITVVK